jgi:hypothetical protein
MNTLIAYDSNNVCSNLSNCVRRSTVFVVLSVNRGHSLPNLHDQRAVGVGTNDDALKGAAG